MNQNLSTKKTSYAQRLNNLQNKGWKKKLQFLNPYRYHISMIAKGQVLEVGCGIGRVLSFIPNRSTGIDHNLKAIEFCQKNNLTALSTEDFFLKYSSKKELFDTLIFSHILEHMTFKEAFELVNTYLPYLKKKGRLILITPQIKGFHSDPTHIEHMDIQTLKSLANNLDIEEIHTYSFPFLSYFGKYFIYNENIFIGNK